jgi:hypothetical protein
VSNGKYAVKIRRGRAGFSVGSVFNGKGFHPSFSETNFQYVSTNVVSTNVSKINESIEQKPVRAGLCAAAAR